MPSRARFYNNQRPLNPKHVIQDILLNPPPNVTGVTPGPGANQARFYFDQPISQIPGAAFPGWTCNGTTIAGIVSVSADAKVWTFQFGGTVSAGDAWQTVASAPGQDQFVSFFGFEVVAATAVVVAEPQPGFAPTPLALLSATMFGTTSVHLAFDGKPVATNPYDENFNSIAVVLSGISSAIVYFDGFHDGLPNTATCTVTSAVTSGMSLRVRGNTDQFISVTAGRLSPATVTLHS